MTAVTLGKEPIYFGPPERPLLGFYHPPSGAKPRAVAVLLCNPIGDDLIRAGLPNDWKIGDKTGRGENGATNDIAIICPPGKPPILLAIYFVGSTATPETRLGAIADVARIVVETF